MDTIHSYRKLVQHRRALLQQESFEKEFKTEFNLQDKTVDNNLVSDNYADFEQSSNLFYALVINV